MRLKRIRLSFLLILLTAYSSFSQNPDLQDLRREFPKDSLYFTQVRTDSLFNSKQIISILAFHKEAINRFRIEFGYSNTDLKPTSRFAETKNAIAAINGGFFDMTKGGSVAYFEINDTLINFTHPSESRWSKPATIINGAIVLTKENSLVIEPARFDSFYLVSNKEAAVLLTGPLLLLNGEKFILQETDFVNKRHPRTFLATTSESLLFITVDGRSEEAEGMNLKEAQEFLLSIGCFDAINLDGGGSTTMWIRDKGIVNYPSDDTGERSVANVILIMRN
jgi:exopolysaccharide biosynthesis protein